LFTCNALGGWVLPSGRDKEVGVECTYRFLMREEKKTNWSRTLSNYNI
jgi:hypothetical protein